MRKEPEEIGGGGFTSPDGAPLHRDLPEEVVPAVEDAEKEADQKEG